MILCQYPNKYIGNFMQGFEFEKYSFHNCRIQGKSDVADMDIRELQRKYQNFAEVTVKVLIWKFQAKYEYVDSRGILLVHFTKSANVVVKVSGILQRHRKL